jgi:anti-sigma B factor antagonist
MIRRTGGDMDLSIQTRDLNGRTVVAVTGELDVHSAQRLSEALAELLDGGSADLVVDLTDLGFLDSTGLGVMVKALRWVKDAGGSLRVVADDDKITKVFTITGMDEPLGLVGSLEAL